MVASSEILGIGKALVAGCAAIFVIAASPASAQGNTPAAQIATSAFAADETQAPLDQGDAEFRELFADWQSFDDGVGLAVPKARPQVSIPSRMPVEGVTLTSGYGMRDHPILRQRRSHKGVDLAAPSGTPVYATADGVISMAQWFSSYGKYVQIEHGAEMQTRYAHLSSYTVNAGDRVSKGELIGYVGSTGRSTGPHLHYEVRVAGDAVNPVPYMVESQAKEQFAMAPGEGGKGGPE